MLDKELELNKERSVFLGVKVPIMLMEDVDFFAARANVTRSDLVRWALTKAIKELRSEYEKKKAEKMAKRRGE